MYQEILPMLLEIAEEFNADVDHRIPVERAGEAPLYGREGVLDSLGLVAFLSAVEQTIEDRLGATVTIADEKAISQKSSPFKTIGSLAEYVAGLVHENV